MKGIPFFMTAVNVAHWALSLHAVVQLSDPNFITLGKDEATVVLRVELPRLSSQSLEDFGLDDLGLPPHAVRL